MTAKDMPLEGQAEPGAVTHAELEYGLVMAAAKGDCQDFITLLSDGAGAEAVHTRLRIGMSQLDKGRGRDTKLDVHLLTGWAS